MTIKTGFELRWQFLQSYVEGMSDWSKDARLVLKEMKKLEVEDI